ncbi:hypothetical protein [Actinomadura flavalba]|uniref:hypothetical protein n=1 Tax=Actinomadura flavalba TaxID=1120938 RepID=UPI00036AE2BD|nr:hypothetical protein [Actinomadura flavalba]
MSDSHSADPWSAFLAPRPHRAAERLRGGTDRERARPARPSEPGTADVASRVLARLREARAPQTFTQLCRGTGLGVLEVAGAVETLRDAGRVTVERGGGAPGDEGDEIVRLLDA